MNVKFAYIYRKHTLGTGYTRSAPRFLHQHTTLSPLPDEFPWD